MRKLWNRLMARLDRFIREHVVDADPYYIQEQKEIIGWCRACGCIVRNADGYVAGPATVLHHGCHAQTAPSPDGPPN
ncbi:hypothetical protein M0Q28_04475 [Patescibacteria group bacterium]|jgi:hypothetical protein|nr:hypothetical protein [Patescibacteria group bacterium]